MITDVPTTSEHSALASPRKHLIAANQAGVNSGFYTRLNTSEKHTMTYCASQEKRHIRAAGPSQRVPPACARAHSLYRVSVNVVARWFFFFAGREKRAVPPPPIDIIAAGAQRGSGIDEPRGADLSRSPQVTPSTGGPAAPTGLHPAKQHLRR